MAVRIYSLAKDLGVDSKDLVDICARAGVTGKGSALASLTEEEVVKIQEYMKGGSAPSAPKHAPPPVTRPRPSRDADRMKVIVTPKAAKPTLAERRKAADEDAAESEPLPAAAELTEVDEAAQQEHREKLAKPGPLAGMVRKEDYIGPASAGRGKMPVVGAKSEGGKGGAKRPPEKAKPAVRLAAMPAAPP
ncbi:MAG: translation initiation factor IF-2 N-terminal domain-containing protein, partial [Planctomycetales bacterium]|nr:translation initiation factor IF-2 N-terminal domain-containing protein [Planctomycetales bacterium]